MPKSSSHPLLKKLGTRVRELREGKGWNQEELADRAQIDRTYISGIERGIRNISLLALAKVAKALGVSPASLLE